MPNQDDPNAQSTRYARAEFDGSDEPTTAFAGTVRLTTAEGAPIVPGYDLLEVVGSGGMGVVYRARDTGLNRDVAIKLLQDRFPAGSPVAERFRDEAQITGQLQHPGIPPVHQVGVLADGRPFLAMRLIRGQNLEDLLKGRPTPDHDRGRFVAIFEQVCQPVAYAHSRGVIHRDLKPANVMVGNFGEVQVMDWGLAKVLATGVPPAAESNAEVPAGAEIRAARDADSGTQAGSLLGTPAYMPPEQAIGAVDCVGERSDVFGLGAILCVILTGRPPFVGNGVEATRQLAAGAKLDDAFLRLGECGAEPELVDLCRRCLAADPANRPASAAAVAAEVAALRAAAEDRARRAELDRAATAVKLAEQRKRRRIQLAFGSAVLVTLLVGGGLAGSQWWRAERALVSVSAEKGRTQQALDSLVIEKDKVNTALVETGTALKAAESARAETITALQALTDQIVGERAGRRTNLTDRDRQYFRDVRRLWQTVADARGNTPEVARLRAEGAYRVSQIQHELGESADAEASFLAAADAFRAIDAGVAEGDRDARSRLADVLTDLATLLHELGRPDEAVQTLRDALGIRGRLVASDPANRVLRFRLAQTRTNLGGILDGLSDLKGASQSLGEALVEWAGLISDDPADLAYQHSRAQARTLFATTLFRSGTAKPAEDMIRAAMSDFEKLTAAQKSNSEFRAGLGKANSNLGTMLLRLGRSEVAEEPLLAARATFRRLAAEFPGLAEYRAELARVENSLGIVYQQTNRRQDAEKAYEEAASSYERLAADLPSVSDYQNQMAGALVNVATLRLDRKDYAAAHEVLARAQPFHAAALKANPKNPAYRQYYWNNLGADGEALLGMGDYARASEVARQLGNFGLRSLDERLLAACYLARCGSQAGRDERIFGAMGAALSAHYSELAVDLLRRAAEAGLDVRRLESTSALAPLRARPDFQRLVEEMKKNGKRGQSEPGPDP